MTYVRMADAAYAANIPPGFDIAAGYYGGPQAYHVWEAPQDWARFPGDRLPIWVAGQDGAGEGAAAAAALLELGVPANSFTAVDMETRKDKTYLEAFGAALNGAGYRVWVYGSASTVFTNPGLQGYWVADYTNYMPDIDKMLQAGHVRAVQFDPVGPYDASLVKQWTEGGMWHG